jgi:hypothetical protein
MPSKLRSIQRVLDEQAWINEHQDDPCLYDELVAAYVSRRHAEGANAPAKALARGDDALDQIKSGRAKGPNAWTKATVAIRRFSEAFGAATGESNRALWKRYGRARPRVKKKDE